MGCYVSKNKLTPVRLANLLGVPVLVGKALCMASKRPFGKAPSRYLPPGGECHETYVLRRKTLTVDGQTVVITVRAPASGGGRIELAVRDYATDDIISLVRFESIKAWEEFRDTLFRNRD